MRLPAGCPLPQGHQHHEALKWLPPNSHSGVLVADPKWRWMAGLPEQDVQGVPRLRGRHRSTLEKFLSGLMGRLSFCRGRSESLREEVPRELLLWLERHRPCLGGDSSLMREAQLQLVLPKVGSSGANRGLRKEETAVQRGETGAGNWPEVKVKAKASLACLAPPPVSWGLCNKPVSNCPGAGRPVTRTGWGHEEAAQPSVWDLVTQELPCRAVHGWLHRLLLSPTCWGPWPLLRLSGPQFPHLPMQGQLALDSLHLSMALSPQATDPSEPSVLKCGPKTPSASGSCPGRLHSSLLLSPQCPASPEPLLRNSLLSKPWSVLDCRLALIL